MQLKIYLRLRDSLCPAVLAREETFPFVDPTASVPLESRIWTLSYTVPPTNVSFSFCTEKLPTATTRTASLGLGSSR